MVGSTFLHPILLSDVKTFLSQWKFPLISFSQKWKTAVQNLHSTLCALKDLLASSAPHFPLFQSINKFHSFLFREFFPQCGFPLSQKHSSQLLHMVFPLNFLPKCVPLPSQLSQGESCGAHTGRHKMEKLPAGKQVKTKQNKTSDDMVCFSLFVSVALLVCHA